jgi:hypothetical protein
MQVVDEATVARELDARGESGRDQSAEKVVRNLPVTTSDESADGQVICFG